MVKQNRTTSIYTTKIRKINRGFRCIVGVAAVDVFVTLYWFDSSCLFSDTL